MSKMFATKEDLQDHINELRIELDGKSIPFISLIQLIERFKLTFMGKTTEKFTVVSKYLTYGNPTSLSVKDLFEHYSLQERLELLAERLWELENGL